MDQPDIINLNKKLAQKEAEQEALTMEIGQLYVKYRNTDTQMLMDILNEKIAEINQVESELHNINAQLGLQ